MTLGWFTTPAAAQADPSLHVVSIRRAANGNVAGAGFVLTANTVLTCAHVVNVALNRAMLEDRYPGDSVVSVQWRERERERSCPAWVEHWIPPRTGRGTAVGDHDDEWFGDLAVLRVDTPVTDLPGAASRAAMDPGQEVRAWHGNGRAATVARLNVVSVHGGLGYLDGDATGMAVGAGYSGGPVWSPTDHAVVGMVVAHYMPPTDAGGMPLPYSPQHLLRRSWALPWQHIEDELRPFGVLGRFGRAALDPTDSALPLLVKAIEDALLSPGDRIEIARRLAQVCEVQQGSLVTPPTAEEIAAFLLTHPRALAAFSGLLRRPHPEAADRILAFGALSGVPRLLSPQEHTELRKHLDGLDREVLNRLPEAARAALPHLAELPRGGSLDGLLDDLESLHGDGRATPGERRVPALLRVMEYAGALCPVTKRAHLRLWADGVAQRLGINRTALGERRSDAQEWARSLRDRARVRVLVQVTRADQGRHGLRIWCDEGAGPRQVTQDSTTTYSASEAARAVLRTLNSLTLPDDDERPPLVEVLVDRTSLNLPVDEWTALVPGELVPGVLGVEYPLVVHCPELLRRHRRFMPHWRSRWNRLDSGETLVVSAAMDQEKIYTKLVNQLDTVRVCVDVPPDSRDAVVQTCLALGIPVVVWDREGESASHVITHTAQTATRELPDEIRAYRAGASHCPPDYPGRPVLAWADADRPLPRLHLSEPQENV